MNCRTNATGGVGTAMEVKTEVHSRGGRSEGSKSWVQSAWAEAAPPPFSGVALPGSAVKQEALKWL
jgi:hypothetical protein